MSKLKLVHLIIGGVTVITFLLTGLYMRKNFPEIYGDNQAMRMMFRGSHIYILLVGLLNIGLGSYLVFSSEVWKKALQFLGSILVLAATFLLIFAFFHEPFQGGILRPWTSLALAMLLAGVVEHFIGSLKNQEKQGLKADQPLPKARINIPTVAAIAVVAYLLSAIIHEAIGHGLTAFLAGAKVKQITNAFVETDDAGLSAWAVRAISAGGCVANFVFGLIFLVWFPTMRGGSAHLRYFFWLLGIINFLKGSGYMFALSFASFGDWHNFLGGLEPKLLWQIGLTLVGIIVHLATFFYAVRSIDEFLGPANRRRRAFALTLTPYLVGGAVNSLAAAVGPGGTEAILFSAALATFGGTWLLVWIPAAVGSSRPTTPAAPLTVTRNVGWIFLGLAGLSVYFFIFGPGLIR